MATPERQADKAAIALGITSSYPEIELSLVDRNPDQPRQDFDDEGDIVDLAKSIKANTLIQAPTVRHHPTVRGRYMIVAGERRIRAMRKVGITRSVVKLIEGNGVGRSYILSAIENLQRVNLNPIEEALSYQRLHDEEHLSWEDIHDITGRDVSVILTKIKLLTLPPEIQEMVRRGTLPQVTALNLSQWRNDEGEYMRMAHDLIAGHDPAVAHFRKETALGRSMVQARLPKTPDDFAKRIVKLSGHVQSMPAVFEAFLRLPFEQQSEVFAAIHPAVLGKLRVRFVALYRATQAVSEQMNVFDAKRAGRAPSPAPTTGPNPEPEPEPPSMNGYNWDLLNRVVAGLFYYGGRRRVNLSRSELEETLGDFLPSGTDLDHLVKATLYCMKMKWRVPPRGDDQEKQFTRTVTMFRRDFGDPKNIDMSFTIAMKEDRSSDPVDLG